MAKSSREDESQLGDCGPKFSPPLYKQRYAAVLDLARKIEARKVVDFGCAECKLLRSLKREPYIEELIGVDIDPVNLELHSRIVTPLITDYLHRRPHPLHMALLQGSIAEPDARLVNFDLVTCIEVIEHLDGEILDAVPHSIFGVIRPRVVVMTTPNAEFNVLFPGFKGFRHHDHRFEWNRLQFQTWCLNAADKYGYLVEFGGVGSPPAERKDVGHCSQMAIFTCRNKSCHDHKQEHSATPYKTVSEAEHPFQLSTLTSEEKLRMECEYYLNILVRSKEEEEEASDADEVTIALEELLVFPRVKSLCSSGGVEDIRSALTGSSSIKFDESGQFVLIPSQGDDADDTDRDGSVSGMVEISISDEPCESWD